MKIEIPAEWNASIQDANRANLPAEINAEIQANLKKQNAAEIQAEIDSQRQVNFKSSMTVAYGFEPVRYGEALQLERKTGVPAKVAYDNWGQVERIKQEEKMAGLFATTPRTADALSNPQHAIIAKGDEENLQYMERAVQQYEVEKAGFWAMTFGKWSDRKDVSNNVGRQAQLERITTDFDRVDAGDDFSSPWANEYRAADEAGRKVMRDNLQLQQNLSTEKARTAQFELSQLPTDPGDVAFEKAEGVAGVASTIVENPMWAARKAGESLPDMAQGLALGLINPIFGSVSEGTTAANYKLIEVLQEKGIDPSDPIQLMKALRDDDLMNEANARRARYGAGIAAVSLLSFGLLGKVMAPTAIGGKALSIGQRELISAGVQMPVQGAMEAAGEATGQLAERGRTSDLDSKEIALEGFLGTLMAVPEAGGFAGKRFMQHMAQARRTERAATLQTDLVGKSLESSTRKNDPATFDAIVGAQLAGKPNEWLEIPAAKLQELNQSGQVNVPELLEQINVDPNHYAAQVELGGTVRMKNSSYLAYLAEYDEQLSSSVRFSTNDMSLEEVQAIDKQMLADMEQVAQNFGKTDQVAAAYSDVMGQLLGAGYERSAADTTARQYAAVMTRLAEQTGQTVEDVMAANPLNIGRDLPPAVRRIKGDEISLMLGRLRAGDIPKPADMFGKSLTEYLTAAGGLDDTGGELAAFDADVGKVSRNRLARAGGKSLDDAAMAAWERGYFPGMAREDVTPNMLVDALREEAAGTPRFSVEQENATLRDQAANLDALQAYLDEQGVDLETATDEEVLALLRGQQDGDQMLNQQDLTPDQQRLVSMSEDEYIAAVNPTGKQTDESDIVIVRTGDLDMPRDARPTAGFKDKTGADVQVFVDGNGSIYAQQDGEVVGQIENRDGETLNIVTVEAQGKGIGQGLAVELIRRDPFAAAGSFSPAGEATRRAAFRQVKAELLGGRRLNQDVSTTAAADAETGKPMTVYFARNTVSSKGNAPAGMDFGQKIEPAGEYMVIQEANMAEQGGKGWEYGAVQFSNPLVLEHKDTTSNGWKKDLSEMFGGKTGKALAKAVQKAGHDAIVTRDKYGYSETVNLSGSKLGGQTLNQSASNVLADKNLIVAHNLSADNLRAALDLGGLPAPSLAITRADAPIVGFGDITLIGDASMAMPSAKNPIFDADVYSPRFPEVKVKVDEAAVRKVIGPLEAAAEAAGIGRGVGSRITEELQRNRLGNAVADVATDSGLRYGYLTQVKGESFDIPMKAQEVARRDASTRGSLIATEPLASVLAGIDVGRVEWIAPESAQIADALYSAMINKFTAEAKDAGRENPEADGFSLANRRINIFADVDEASPDALEVMPGVIYNPPKLMKPNGLKRIADMLANTPSGEQQAAPAQMVVDRIELDRHLSELVPDGEIRAWARDQLAPSMGERRIVKDNGRTAAYSLDNLVKEMTRKVRDSEGFNYGLGNARSRGAIKFKSLQQIQGRRDQVQSKADTESAIEQNKKLYDELLEKLTPYHPGRGRGYGRSAWEALPDAIGESYSIGIERALAENEFVDVPADLVEQVKEFASELLQLPTEYFEAKPQRAVMLSEFSGAVVPAGTPADLIAALEGQGLQVSEYAKGDDAARAQAVQQSATALNEERGTTLFQSQPSRKPAETIYIDSMTGDGTTKVLKNPTRNQALAFAKAAKYESLRGIVDPVTGDLYIADSHTVDHKMLAEGVGLVWEDVRYSTDPDTGSSNRLSIPAKAIEFYPRNIFSDDNRLQTLNQSLPQTETEAFKKWFGDSKVVDAQGKPLVVYHGTGADITQFDPERSGTKSKTGAPEGTFFFTDAADVASSYTVEYQGDFSTKYVPDANVVPAYLSIRKPLKVSAKGESWRSIVYKGDLYDINELAKLAQESGKYDGLIVTKVKDKGRGDVTSKTATTYVAFKPEQIKSAIGNRGTFDPASPNILEQSGDDDARGSITFGPRHGGVRRFDIKLGKKSDLSTVLHEMGHYYLEVIGDLVMDGKANEALAADYGVIRDWLGAEAGKPLTVDQHEQFARGFEKYLATGKAPSIELQDAFARFKRWLVGVYKDLARLNVEISPEVRGVFDRLLASEQAITEAEQALAMTEQYEARITELMSPDEKANYLRASRQARDDATSEIEQEILKAEQQKEQRWYKEQRRKVEAEVRDELEASQAYQARKYLFGNTPHPDIGRPLRLDTAAVTELFGTKSKEARFLGRARARENGVHPEIAASILGYPNPVEMLTDMRAVPSMAEAVKLETERRMAERYPDPRKDGTLADKAMAAVGEREAEVQAIQLRTLARQAGRAPSQHKIIKEAARRHIASLKLRDVIPHAFRRASEKAARAVEDALIKGDMPKAYEEKEKQLMNLHLFREAVKAQDLSIQKRAQAKAYTKAGAKRKRLQDASVENYELAYPDGRIEYAATKTAAKQAEVEGATVTPLFNFLEQVDAILTRYEFSIPRRAIRQQREALVEFLASMSGEHIVVNPPEWILLDRSQRTNWSELTIDELVDAVDMIKQIDQMAKNKLQVLKAGRWEEFEPIRDAIVNSIELNASAARSSQFNKSFADDIRRWGREWLGLLPVDQIARELDGQDDLGPVQENITTPVQVAARKAVIREKAEHQALAELIKQFYSDDQIKGMAEKRIAVAEINDSLTKMQMIMLMANLGNEGNRKALMSEQRGIWSAETIQSVMSRLDSNDADFVEALWAWVDKFWPEVSENEARRTGVTPAKVENDPYPVKLADGKVRVLKGGYFPLKYDGDMSIKTSQDDVANAFKNMTAGRTAKAYTPEGHRIERVGSGGRPVKLDLSVVLGHVNEVVRDIVMTDQVNQSWRYLHDGEIQGAFERSNLKEIFTALEIWLQDTAEGEKVDSGYMTASARWLRTGFTANVMLFNLANSALNLAGTHPLVVLGKRWALNGYRNAMKPANWQQMYELSEYMREARVDSYSKDLQLVQDHMRNKGGWRDVMTQAGFYLHNKTQMFMDAVTWMGAYEKGMSLDLVGQELITYADQRVVEASGSGVFADRSAMERGTITRQTRQNELVRGLTTLAGYMIRKMAIARRRTAETDFKDVAQAVNWAVDMALLFTVEGLMFALVKGNVPDEEDEDQASGWAKAAGWETFAGALSGLPPYGRPLVSAIQGFGGGSSSIDIFAEQFGNALTQAKQGDADVTAAKALIAMVGTATKTPGIATNRVIDWLDRAQDGETPPWYELLTGNRDK